MYTNLIFTNKPGTRGQASNGIQEHYADKWVSECVMQWVDRGCINKLPYFISSFKKIYIAFFTKINKEYPQNSHILFEKTSRNQKWNYKLFLFHHGPFWKQNFLMNYRLILINLVFLCRIKFLFDVQMTASPPPWDFERIDRKKQLVCTNIFLHIFNFFKILSPWMNSFIPATGIHLFL